MHFSCMKTHARGKDEHNHYTNSRPEKTWGPTQTCIDIRAVVTTITINNKCHDQHTFNS